ncbi:MAG: MFS transporter [Chloroflexi bacterium]|nr:MFS transporter [Chloroflexota bacterium]
MHSGRALNTVASLVPRVYIQIFTASIGMGMLVPTLPLFVADLVRDPVTGEENITLVGLALGMAALGTLLWTLPSGLLLNRISEWVGQVVGLIVMATAVLVLALSPPYSVLIVARLLMGAGMGLWALSRMQYMRRVTPRHQRGRIMSLFGGTNRIGMFVGPGVGGFVAGTLGYEAMFLIAGACMAVGLIPGLAYRDAPDNEKASTQSAISLLRGLGETLMSRRRVLFTAGIGHIFAQAIRSGRPVVLPLYGAFALGLNEQEIGLAVSASAAVDMTLFPLAGYLMDHFGRKFAIVPSFALFSASMALLSQARDFTGLILIGLLIGFSNGIGSGSMLTLGTDLTPSERPGEFLAVWRLVGGIGDMGGPVVVGGVADVFGLMLAPFFVAALGLCGALTFGLFVPETLEKRSTVPGAEP